MSKTYRSPGAVINAPAPANVTAGVPIRIGNLLAVPLSTVLSGVECAFSVDGEHELPADSADTWSVGELVDFDASTATIQPASFTTGAGDIVGCGVATKAKLAGETTAWVKINTGGGTAA